MDLYQSGGYGDALRREVEERIGTTSDGQFALKVHDVGVGGTRGRAREVVSRYISTAEPIAVIGVLLKALESVDGVVHVDLHDRTVLRGNALEHAGRQRGGTVRLRDIDAYVSVRGMFRLAGRTDTTAVLLACFGDPDDPAEGPQVRVECHNDGLRHTHIPDDPFHARCLGRVQAWRAREAEWVIRPVAIFQ